MKCSKLFANGDRNWWLVFSWRFQQLFQWPFVFFQFSRRSYWMPIFNEIGKLYHLTQESKLYISCSFWYIQNVDWTYIWVFEVIPKLLTLWLKLTVCNWEGGRFWNCFSIWLDFKLVSVLWTTPLTSQLVFNILLPSLIENNLVYHRSYFWIRMRLWTRKRHL